LNMIKTHRLEKLISEGSSAVYFSLNPAVPSNEIWTKENGLEKSISAKNPGDAVTLIGKMEDKKGKESYFLHGVYELIPFSSNSVNDENFKDVYKSMIPGVAYMNPMSIGINNEDFNNLDKETGPVKKGNKEFLGVVNLDYLNGLKKSKVSDYFINGAYLVRKPGKEKGEYVYPSIKYKTMQNVGQGAGLISSKITDKIADLYGFPRPRPGDVVVGIGYFEDSVIGYKKHEPYAFSMIVSALGDRIQVPPDAIDSMYLEVILGVNRNVGKKLI
jgi:hypothetical protein